MIIEQILSYNSNYEEILKQLSEEGKYIEEIDNIELNFYGNKKLLKKEEKDEILNDTNNHNNYLVVKYKDSYTGCLSIKNICLREKFGLNKYFNDLFYIGQWKENKKEGIGFLKMNENILYLGEFINNQINGFGMIYYKDKGYFYFGNFIDGQMDKGVYYNYERSLFYHGKFKDGKKNDELCFYFDINNNNIFIGEVKDDNFIRGYISLCEILEEQKGNIIQTNFDCGKVIFFDKTDPNNVKYEHSYFFDNDFYDKLQNIFISIFEADLNLKDLHDFYIAYFENLENIVYNDSYTEYPERYNPKADMYIENSFINNYNAYYKRLMKSQEKLNLENYKNIIKEEPKMNNYLKMNIK